MKFLINKVVIFTLVNNLKVTALVEGIYKKFLVVKVPVTVNYYDDIRQPTDIEKAISEINEVKKEIKNYGSNYGVHTLSGYSIKEFSYHMLPIVSILKYEVSKEDLISIITKGEQNEKN